MEPECSSANRSTAERSSADKSSADRSTAESEKSSIRSSADRSTADKSSADRSTAEKQSVGEEEEMPDLQDKDVQRVTQKMQFAFRSKKSPQPPAEQGNLSKGIAIWFVKSEGIEPLHFFSFQ